MTKPTWKFNSVREEEHSNKINQNGSKPGTDASPLVERLASHGARMRPAHGDGPSFPRRNTAKNLRSHCVEPRTMLQKRLTTAALYSERHLPCQDVTFEALH